jgi:rare lipoprotein A
MKRHMFIPCVLVVALISFGCATTTISGPATTTTTETTTPSKNAKIVETFEGTASWYGPEFHGKKTASGEIFDMTDLTAAHKTLPMGTTCIVTNLKNSKSVTVRINDRGPFAKDRVIDLSYAAAGMIGMITSGTAYVRVEVLAGDASVPVDTATPTATEPTDASPPATAPSTVSPIAETPVSNDTPGTIFTIQVGSFSNKANAETLYASLAEKYSDVLIDEFSTTDTTYWRVRLGKFSSREDAQKKAEELTKAGYTVFITPR